MYFLADSKCRLQVKGGLFWYGHYPNMHEMVSDGTSWVDLHTDLREISVCGFLEAKDKRTHVLWSNQTRTCRVSWKHILVASIKLEKLQGSTFYVMN